MRLYPYNRVRELFSEAVSEMYGLSLHGGGSRETMQHCSPRRQAGKHTRTINV
ncbi:predicted protein [Sclerotinia sclerotiorum 1980 UF-70]|uniref:Uncharacterized protein n=1 Tax=Sclerotinia sclerotiorum (strain ATCC 18683 / 1980 / Ss-1) TaxID=665079 RepID=A7F5X9_SCLS1|nr:predicted protein [Sclerotinia sclerotiorum 1980 UF-70]EDN98150.1 predicted protein [Sclerotinia sclerotiorum 1980 UF-70]